MNTEEIIKLAREAGGYDEFTSPPTNWNKGDFVISPEQLSKFAALVRNAALKEVIRIIEEYRIPVGNSPAGELACEWTRDALADIRDAIQVIASKDQTLKTYIVLYRDDSLEHREAPFAFVCEAEGADHAEEQCENTYPGANIVWIHEGACIEDAYAEYWDT